MPHPPTFLEEPRTADIADIRAKFQRGAVEHPNLKANWDSRQEVWTLSGPRAGKAKREAERLFKEATRAAVRWMGKPLDERPSWHVWLDLMRKEKRGFRWIYQLRHWRGGASVEEFMRSSTVPSDAVQTDYGYILHVFQFSAEYYEDLAPARLSADLPGADRRKVVDSFILRCNQEISLKVTRTHLWKAAGHKHARQFQFWQKSSPKATAQDEQNFSRLVAMTPTDFESLLKRKGMI